MRKHLTNLIVLLLILAAMPLLVAVAAGLYFARLMVNPPRARHWKTPADESLPYENIHFEASDGVPISGWFIRAPTSGPGPAVAIVHGWTWQRLGNVSNDLLTRITRALPVELLKPARALHDAGYHVLMFDLRNHGRSGSSPTVTFGHDEAGDLLGAVSYLQGRKDVDTKRIGALGYSMGANTVMFACAATKDIKAAIAVQPIRPNQFANRLATSLLGPLGRVALNVALQAYYHANGPLLEIIDPGLVVDLISPTAIMYVQSDGDPWGDVSTVRRFHEQTKEPKALHIVTSPDRFGGYLYLSEHPQVMLEFFDEYLAG